MEYENKEVDTLESEESISFELTDEDISAISASPSTVVPNKIVAGVKSSFSIENAPVPKSAL